MTLFKVSLDSILRSLRRAKDGFRVEGTGILTEGNSGFEWGTVGVSLEVKQILRFAQNDRA